MDKNTIQLRQSSIWEVATCSNSECIMQMVANTHECYSVPGIVLGFYTSCINVFNCHNRIMNSIHRLILPYRYEIQGTEKRKSLPRSHMASKQQNRGVRQSGLRVHDLNIQQALWVSKSGQTVKQSLRILVSTTIMKNSFAWIMGNCHARRIKDLALANGVSLGWKVRRHRIRNLYK